MLGGPTRRTVSLTAAALLGISLLVAPAGGEEATPEPGPCGAPATHPGGEWTMYGHDLANTRSQPLEDRIGPGEVGDLELAWIFSAEDAGGGGVRAFSGALNNTPVIAEGCLVVAASDGWVDALDADTGEVVWSRQLDATGPGFGGGVVGTPAVGDGVAYVIVNKLGAPAITALDLATGEERWHSVIEDTPRAMTNASVVLYDGLIFAGFSGASAPPPEPGGFSILDAATGQVLKTTHTIPADDVEDGYGGASIWSTAAVDVATGYAYVGTGNPHSLDKEHPHTNSIIKVDLDRDRDTFGEILAAYKGERDSYVDGLDRQPLCRMFPDIAIPAFGFSLTCLQLDLDFGASPNLFTDDRGRLRVGALQKSGVYHAIDATSMARSWRTVLAPPCLACNASSAAFDGERIFVAAGPPANMFGLDRSDGDYGWVAPVAGSITHYNPSTHANGVVYTVDGAGFLNAYDAGTGLTLLKHDMGAETGDNMFSGSSSSGVAIARGTVYVATTAGYVLAYRLPS